MRLLCAVALLFGSCLFTIAQTRAKPCDTFRVAGPVRRVLFEGNSRRVGLFDLETYDANFLLAEPKTQYSDILRTGSWIVVVGCTCQDHRVFALWLRRGRRFSNRDKDFRNVTCPVE